MCGTHNLLGSCVVTIKLLFARYIINSLTDLLITVVECTLNPAVTSSHLGSLAEQVTLYCNDIDLCLFGLLNPMAAVARI